VRIRHADPPQRNTRDQQWVDIAADGRTTPQLLISIGTGLDQAHARSGIPVHQKTAQHRRRKELVGKRALPDEVHDYGPLKRKALYPFLRETPRTGFEGDY